MAYVVTYNGKTVAGPFFKWDDATEWTRQKVFESGLSWGNFKIEEC